MARPLRIQAPGLTYHITSRGIRRTSIYLDDEDRRRFLAILAAVVERYALRCHAYCEMTNHYHLAVTTMDANLSRAVQQLNGAYARWWNWRHERAGHLFEARYKAQIVQDERYLLNVCRYIVLNPVRAGVVHAPELWPWSSYRATEGLTAPPPFLHRERVLATLGTGDSADGEHRFRRTLVGEDGGAWQLPRASVIGDDAFIASLQRYRTRAGREVPRHDARRSLEAIFRGAVTRAARNAAVITAFRERFAVAEIARHLEVHPSTVSKIVRGQVPEREKTIDSRSDPSP